MTALKSCETCMEMHSAEHRQGMGCGFELPPEVRLPVWTPEAFPDHGGELTTCSGYSTRLPEVFEVARARSHWSKGQLETFLGGETPNEMLLYAIDIMEGSTNELELARVTPKSKGGLAADPEGRTE